GVREPGAHRGARPGLPGAPHPRPAAPDGSPGGVRGPGDRARPRARAPRHARRHALTMARGTLVSELRTVADDAEAVLAYVEAQGWGDGLPVIPPTEARVQAMLDATPLPPAYVVGVVEPRRGEATVEKIAV